MDAKSVGDVKYFFERSCHRVAAVLMFIACFHADEVTSISIKMAGRSRDILK